MTKLIKMCADSALVLVEPQFDFTRPEGAFHLDGAEAVRVMNRLIKKSPWVMATYDWHRREPVPHVSFAKWGKHCVPMEEGAQPDPDLDISTLRAVLMKGVDADDDIYDSFDIPTMEPLLRSQKKKTLFIAGSAVPICPSLTAMSAARLGFDTFLVIDACCVIPGTNMEDHIAELIKAGVRVVTSNDIDLS